MFKYPKIDDESILLDKECKQLLKRSSRKYIIEEVINKLNNKEIKEKNNKNITLLEILIMIFTCNIYKYENYN